MFFIKTPLSKLSSVMSETNPEKNTADVSEGHDYISLGCLTCQTVQNLEAEVFPREVFNMATELACLACTGN